MPEAVVWCSVVLLNDDCVHASVSRAPRGVSPSVVVATAMYGRRNGPVEWAQPQLPVVAVDASGVHEREAKIEHWVRGPDTRVRDHAHPHAARSYCS